MRRALFPCLALFAAPLAAQSVSLSSAALTCEHMEYRGGLVLARDNVVLRSSGSYFLADRMEVQASSRIFRAEGDVQVQQGATTLLCHEADYDWGRSTGTFQDAYVEEEPWRLWAEKISRDSPDLYRFRAAALTSCELDPPHYHVRLARGAYHPQKRASALGAWLTLGKTPVFFWPFYSRSLKEKRWTLTVDPGKSARDGIFAKSILTLPLTTNTRARLYWDHFQRTGEGLGAEFGYDRPDVRGAVYGYRVEDRKTHTERRIGRLTHWQQLAPRWTVQANALLQSDANFSNQFSLEDFHRVRQTAESDAAVTYQSPLYSARVFMEQDQAFDAARVKFVRQRTVLPQFSVQTSPLKAAGGVYVTGRLNARNEYLRPQNLDPSPGPLLIERDRFRRSGDAGVDLRKSLRVTKNVSLEPSVGTSAEWSSWRNAGAGSIDRRDQVVGRGFTSVNLRHRLTRRLDYDLGHTYRMRWRPNALARDRESQDQGEEANALTLFVSYRARAGWWARLQSGYDLRQKDGETLRSVRRKITPPVADVSFQPGPWARASYRQVQALYPVNRPQSTQFSLRLGRVDEAHFESGHGYDGGSPGQVRVRHRAAFPLTKNWWLEGGVRYAASGPRGLRYNSVDITEKNLTVKRDLHCWRARMDLNERPGGVREIFFRIDLVSNLKDREALETTHERQFTPGRNGR